MILCVKAAVECKTRQACGLYFVYIVITSFIMVDGSVDFTEVEFQDVLTFTHTTLVEHSGGWCGKCLSAWWIQSPT